jgi:hypothetical protein
MSFNSFYVINWFAYVFVLVKPPKSDLSLME